MGWKSGAGHRFFPLTNSLAILLSVLLTCFAVAVTRLQQPPDIISADGPASEFSAVRAATHLTAIARAPRPVGSAYHDRIRDYLFIELSALGVPPEVQKSTALRENGSVNIAADVQNVVARLKGTDSSGAVLLMSHYDSVPTGPGASDDGHAVAVLLETLRALRVSPRLKNDIVFLFTDGEELGLLGAQAFVTEHPWAKDVSLVLDFEARGNRGPAMMFETSPENERLISEFARSAPYPAASSLYAAIYRLMPNDTDFSVFNARGYAGLNFAYIEGLTHYHTKLDNIQEIDWRSIQHQGSCALALARHFGNEPLPLPQQPDACYFNLSNSYLVHYPSQWSKLFVVLAWGIFAAGLFLGLRRRVLGIAGLAAGLLVVVCVALTGAGLATFFGLVLERLRDPSRNLYAGQFFFLSSIAGVVCWSTIAYNSAGRRLGANNLFGGAILLWGILALGTAWYLPGGNYLFVWPMLSAATAFVCLNRSSFAKDDRSAVAQLVVVSIGALPGFFLIGPLPYQIFVAMAFSALGFVAILVALVFGLIAPHFAVLKGWMRWLVPGAAASLGLVFLVAGLVGDFDENHPKPDTIYYLYNSDRSDAFWVSADRKVDKWTEQFLSNEPERAPIRELLPISSLPMMKHPAPALRIPGPKVSVLNDTSDGEFRIVRLRIVSVRQAPTIAIIVEADAEPYPLEINGTPVRPGVSKKISSRAQADGRGWALVYANVPAGGFELTLRTRREAPLTGIIVDQSFGLPEMAGLRPRPEDTMPGARWGDSTWVSKSFNVTQLSPQRHDEPEQSRR